MKLKYWTGFTKRKNSTKIPTGTGTEVDVYLKENTSIDNPTVILKGNAINIDYAYIQTFGKYYFVGSPVILTNGTTQYDLEEDVLATHKTDIGSTNAHIAYSSTGYDVTIPDPRIAAMSTQTKYTNVAASGFDSTGCYIIGVLNDQTSGKVGAISYYICDQTALEKIAAHLVTVDFKNEIAQIFTGDWLQLIPSLIWVPLSLADARNTFGTGVLIPGHALTIGSGDAQWQHMTFTDVTVYDVTTPSAQISNVSLSIPYKWQDFRDCQPYTSASLYLVGLGETDININEFYDSVNVSIVTNFDIITGDVIYRVYDDNGVVLKTVMFNGGVQVALAHITSNAAGSIAAIGGTVSGIAGAGISIATGNVPGVIGAGVGILASASSGLLNANQRSTSIKGTNMGRSAFALTNFVLTLTCIDTEDPDDADYIARFGRPVALTHAISNHSGYVQCENASVDIAGDNYERDSINAYLNSGFYYE